MDPLDAQPWVEDCLAAADVRAGERIVQVGAHPLPLSAGLRAAAGREGSILVLEPDRADAELAAEAAPPGVEVVHAALEPPPALGRHDCVVAVCEEVAMLTPGARAGMVRDLLRPGGRFLLDLPAPRPCEVLQDVWTRCGGERSALDAWRGPDEETLADELRGLGMRSVEAAVATHLLRTDGTRSLAAWLMARLGTVDPDLLEGLTLTLTERMRGPGPCEVVVHRTRVRGLF